MANKVPILISQRVKLNAYLQREHNGVVKSGQFFFNSFSVELSLSKEMRMGDCNNERELHLAKCEHRK